MDLHPFEETIVRAFFIPAKRERWLSLLQSGKQRKKALNSLNHFTDWDPRYVRPVAPDASIVQMLREAGAPEECHMISCDPALDGRDIPLVDAVKAAEAFSFASILCCAPGRLAFFFDEVEAPRSRSLLRRH